MAIHTVEVVFKAPEGVTVPAEVRRKVKQSVKALEFQDDEDFKTLMGNCSSSTTIIFDVEDESSAVKS
jgi:hypothetical protein